MALHLAGDARQSGWMRWEEALWNAMHFVDNIRTQKWRVIKRKTTVLLITYMVLDAFQVYALLVGAHGGYDTRVTSKVLSYIDVYNLLIGNNFENYKAFFWMSVVAMLVDVLLLAYVVYRLRRQGAPVKSARYFRVTTNVLMKLLLIAVLKMMAAPFMCGATDWVYGTSPGAGKPLFECPKGQWAFYVAVGAAVLSFLVPAAIVLVSAPCDFNIHSDDWEARPHSRFHLPELLYKFALVAVCAAFPYTSVALNWALLAATCLMFYWLLNTLPYYNPVLNEIKGGTWAGGIALCLGGVILPSAGENAGAATGLFLAAAPAAAVVGVAVVKLRARHLAKLRGRAAQAEAEGKTAADAVAFRNEMEVELATRFLRTEGDTEAAIADAERLYKAGLAQYPTSAYVLVSYAAFLRWRKKAAIQAVQELKGVARTEPTADNRYAAYVLRAYFEAENHSGASGQDDVFSSIENRRLYALARGQHATCLKQLKGFWHTLSKKNLVVQGALSDVPARLSSIDAARKAATKAYRTLLDRFPRSRLVLRAYGHFLEHCANDPVNAQNMYLRADEIEEEENAARMMGGRDRAGDKASAAGRRSHAGTKDDDENSASTGDNSSSQGGSSSHNSSQKGRGRRGEELRLRSTDVVAVRRLGYGVILGLILLAGSAAGMYIVVKVLFGQYTNAMYLMRVASYQRRRIVAANSFMRSMHLSALRNNSVEFRQHADELRIRAEDFHGDHYGLYHGFPEVGILPSKDPNTVAFWKKDDIPLIRVLPATASGAPEYRRIDMRSVWDVGNVWIMKAKRLAYTTVIEKFHNPGALVDVLFLMNNSLGSVLDAIAGLNTAFTTEVYTIIDTSKIIFGCVMAFRIATLLVLTFAVFRPAFRKVRGTMQGISTILTGLSKHSLKKMGRRYAKIKGFKGGPERRHGHGHGHGAEGEAGAAGAAGNEYEIDDDDDDDDDNDSQDAGSDNESEKSSASDRSGRRRDRDGDDEEEEEAGSAAGDGEEGGERRKKKKRKEKKLKKARRRGGDEDEEEEEEAGEEGGLRRGAPGGASQHSIVLRGTAKHRARRESVLAGEAEAEAGAGAGAGEEAAAAAPAPIAEGEAEGEETAGSGGEDAAARAAAAAVAAVDGKSTGRKSKRDKKKGEEEGDETGRHHSHSHRSKKEGHTHRSKKEGHTHRSKKGKSDGEEEAGEKGADAAEGQEEGEEGPKASRRVGRRSSLKPTPAATVQPAGTADPAAALPNDSAIASGMGLRVTGVLRRRTARRPVLPEALAGRGLVTGRSDQGKQGKGHAHAKKGGGEEDEGRGEDILDSLTRKYLLAFVLIGAVALANFLIAFFVLEAGKGFASELEAAGQRRYLAREIYFLSRELYINDGLFGPREAIFARLRQSAEDLRTVQAGLKFGNSSLRLPGADKRYKPQDQIMYDAGCLRTDAALCTPDRVADLELVNNGLDLLVAQFVDLVIPIIQECAPDLLVPYAFQPHTSVPAPKPKVADYAGVEASLAVRMMTQVDNGDLDDGLSRSARLFVDESEIQLGAITLAEAGILAFDVAFLSLLFVFLFLPMLRRLRDESSRVDQLLRMFPKVRAGGRAGGRAGRAGRGAEREEGGGS
eukprot:tig00020572_g11562.t1